MPGIRATKSQKRRLAIHYLSARAENELYHSPHPSDWRLYPQLLALQRCAIGWLVPCPARGQLLHSYERMLSTMKANDAAGRAGPALFSQIDLMRKRHWVNHADFIAAMALIFGDDYDPTG